MSDQPSILFEAVKRVPVMKYALAVAGLATVVGIIYSVSKGYNIWVTFIGIGIILLFMVILIVLSRAAFSQQKKVQRKYEGTVASGDIANDKWPKSDNVTLSDVSEEKSGHWMGEKGSHNALHGPVVVLTWGAVTLFLVTACLFVSCLFFKQPSDISGWFGPGGSDTVPISDHRDYTLYLQDRLNSLPVDLDANNLLLRVYGTGDLGFDRASNGTYRFRPFVSAEDSGTLIITGDQEWMFENKAFERKIPLKYKDITAFLIKNPASLVLSGVITRNNAPLAYAIVSTRTNGKTIADTTNAEGEFEIKLPENARDRTFSMTVVFKVNSKKTIRDSFPLSPGLDGKHDIKK